MRDISVRQAVLSDLDHLASLFDQYRQFQRQAPDLAAARDFLRARFDHGESIIFIAYDGEQPVGFAQLYPSFSSVSLKRVFILNDLFVSEAGRRKGVATQLLAALEAYAWSLGAARITLNVGGKTRRPRSCMRRVAGGKMISSLCTIAIRRADAFHQEQCGSLVVAGGPRRARVSHSPWALLGDNMLSYSKKQMRPHRAVKRNTG